MADGGKSDGRFNEHLPSGIPSQSLKRTSCQAPASHPRMKNGPEESSDSSHTTSPAGSNTTGGSSSRELRSEEAELAAVIAKVTGRASPFVDEFDDGKRKFTILCGEAANVGDFPADGAASSTTTQGLLGSRNFTTFGYPVRPSAVAPNENYTKPRIVGVEYKKNFGTGNKALAEHDSSRNYNVYPNRAKRSKMSVVMHGAPRQSEDDSQAREWKSNVNHSKKTADLGSLDEKSMKNHDSNIMPPDVSDSQKVDNKDHKSKRIDENLVESVANQLEVASEVVKDNKTDSTDGKADDNGDRKVGLTKTISAIELDTVKACFPSKGSAAEGKSFDVISTEVKQNIINRRMAARNATAIAEFDPLVSMSPEAQKLALWATGKPLKKSIFDPDDSVAFPSSPDSCVKTSTAEAQLKKKEDINLSRKVEDLLIKNNFIKASSKDPLDDGGGFYEGLVKGPGKQTDVMMSPEALPPREDDLMIKSIPTKDGELGNGRIWKNGPVIRSKHWMVTGLLMIVILVAVFLPLMILRFKFHFFDGSGNEITEGVITVDHYEPSSGNPEGLLEELEVGFSQNENINMSELEGIFEELPDEEDFAEENDPHQEETALSTSAGRFKGNKVLKPQLEDNSLRVKPKPTRQSVCSSLNSKVAPLCERIKPLVLKLLFKSVLLCHQTKDILLPGYIQMYRYLNSFLSSFGGFAAVQTKMLEERVNQLENYTLGGHRLDYQKLFKMVYFEISTGTIVKTSPFSGTILFTCLHRHLQYLTLTFEYILTIHPDQSLRLAFDTAYEKILAKHHTWIVESMYEVGMNMLPTKNQATLLLSIRQVEKVMMHELEESLGLVIAELRTLNDLAESILNKTDVFSVIPGQVIT
ncbi:uncharacterized protein [Macrobrachium rosenbergii]|uniref:uncharacterized protein n=1 Tax=Macrobrachium rosenbergii TaxID=79674 RepID=UPI0034D6D3E0